MSIEDIGSIVGLVGGVIGTLLSGAVWVLTIVAKGFWSLTFNKLEERV